MLNLALSVVFLVCLYLFGTKSYNYWKKKGVKHDKPIPFFGNNILMYLRQKSSTQIAHELYWKYSEEKVVGFYRATKPELIIRDPEIIKCILVKDFSYFHKRGIITTQSAMEPLSQHLFLLDGDFWKLLRQRMTPAFSSGKLKAMFPLIVERAERLQNNAINAPPTGLVLDSRDLMARYTTEFIASCGFGIDLDCLSEKNSAFRKLGVEIFKVEISQIIVIMLKEMFPETFKHLKLLGKIEKDMYQLLRSVLESRNYEKSSRNDFIDLLLECKNKGKIVGDSIEKFKPDGTPEEASLEINEKILLAQVFLFFAAGFETSSSATSFTLHQLAYHPEVQQKVQKEIDTVLTKYDNKLCYDAINEMTYLQCAFNEGMRILPSLGFLVRECSRKYTIADLDLTIDEGVSIHIPLQSLHMDPLYFEEPEKFRPERFLTDFINPMTRHIYLPFGDGPRACIGGRLGRMQSLAGLAAVLSRYSVEPAEATQRYPTIDTTSNAVQNIKGGLPLLFRARTD